MKSLRPAAHAVALLTILLAGLGAATGARRLMAEEPAAEPAETPESPYAPIHRDPLGTHLIDLPTPFTLGARRLEVIFNHRFQDTVSAGGSSNLWGLDSGADVGIGLAWGVTKHFDLAVFRSSFQKDFELSGKYLFLEQAERVPLSLAVRAGTDLLRQQGVADPNRPFAQLLLSRSFGHGVNLFVAPTWVRDTPSLRNATTVPLGFSVGLPHGSYVEAEYVPKNHDLGTSVAAWHVALAKPIGAHLFSLVLGNSRATTVDQYAGGDSAAGFKSGDVRLGFNLVRYFDY
jgi:hypothetical protein